VSPLALAMCHPLVCARLAKVVGDVTETLGVQDFGTPGGLEHGVEDNLEGLELCGNVSEVWEIGTLEELGCSVVERPKVLKSEATWKAYGTSGVRDSGRFRA
jgi:hypothetical protein